MTEHWQWWYSNTEEHYQGPCETREEAIATGFHEFAGEGILYILEATQQTPGTDIFDFDRVMEDFCEQNEECWGEDGEPFSDLQLKDQRDLENRLSAVLRNYLMRNNALRSWAFGATRNEEQINMEVATVALEYMQKGLREMLDSADPGLKLNALAVSAIQRLLHA